MLAIVLKDFLERFLFDEKGNVAILAAILLVPLLIGSGVAVDYSTMINIQDKLQATADSAALASAKEISVAGASEDIINEVAKNQVVAHLDLMESHEVQIVTSVQNNNKDVKIDLAYTWQPMFLQYFNPKALPIKASATGSIAGSERICVIALDNTSPSTLSMTGVSSIETVGCSIYSNSVASSGVSAVTGSLISSPNTYTSGGFEGAASSFSPMPITDTAPIPDPLLDRQPPSSSACDYGGIVKPKGTIIFLKPGVYCGGITINGKVTIQLEPGVYVMKDGPLSIGGNSTIIGDKVGFYFTGTNSTLSFGVSTQASLSAPISGPMAGLLFFEDRSSPIGREFIIRSKDAEKFEGTVYLPRGRFVLDKASRVGQSSKWTAIIANQIEVRTGPELRINSDYGLSPIPVPDGIGPNSPVRLKN